MNATTPGAASTPGKPQRSSKPRTRSPGYPSISLSAAIDKAQSVWQHEKRNAAPLEALAAAWGINAKSSSFLLAVSALKKYGLLVELGDSNGRLLKLTDSALNLIL